MLSFLLILSFNSLFFPAVLGDIGGLHASDDLHRFYSRPDLRPPKFYVKKHHAKETSHGYFFTAPYGHSSLTGEAIWAACQAGPAIYDSDGELVWTGGCRYGTTYDFRAADCDGKPNGCMSFNIRGLKYPDDSRHGSGVILDNTYEVKQRINIDHRFDLHEFNVLPGGKTALYINNNAKAISFKDMGFDDDEIVRWTSLHEVDLSTGEITWSWDTPTHLSLNQSTFHPPQRQGTKHESNPWDYDHVNSIDKNDDGDYLGSFRHTNCVLKISGKDGHVMWQLGGHDSDFDMEDLHFTRQHHARFIESTKDYTIMSFLDNASGKYGRKDGEPPSHEFSRGLIVKANHPKGKPTTAETYRAYDRPDGKLTELRGSVQSLPNGNVLVGWSKGGYQSEHTEDGKLVEESGFVSERYDTYRSYKYKFVGEPKEPPHMAAFVYGASKASVVTVFYVSWNGATEVKSWKFYAKVSGTKVHLGSIKKTGFETMFMYEGYAEEVFAEGLGRDGNVLGKTKTTDTVRPQSWKAAGYPPDEQPPSMKKLSDAVDWKDKIKDKVTQKVTVHDVDFPVAVFALIPLGGLILWLYRRRLPCCSFLRRGVRRRLSNYQMVPGNEEEMGYAT